MAESPLRSSFLEEAFDYGYYVRDAILHLNLFLQPGIFKLKFGLWILKSSMWVLKTLLGIPFAYVTKRLTEACSKQTVNPIPSADAYAEAYEKDSEFHDTFFDCIFPFWLSR